MTKELGTPTDTELIVEAMYLVAADPDRWVQLVEVLADIEPRDAAPPSAVRALAHVDRVADLASAGARPAPEPRAPILGWIGCSASGRVVAGNPEGFSFITAGLGAAELGAPLHLRNEVNRVALEQALAQAQSANCQTIVRFERDDLEGVCFAYVAPAGVFANTLLDRMPERDRGQVKHLLLFPTAEEVSGVLAALSRDFGLTAAEVRLAARLREGLTLKDAAADLGVSFNTVRNQLRAVFDKMGLNRQSDLVRALSQLSQLSRGVVAPAAEVNGGPPAVQVHRLPDGRGLAYRMYGVTAGRPLLMFHEGLGSSLLPPGAQALAEALGLQVISLERPGFGKSDPDPSYSFDGVADDVVHLCDSLGITTTRIAAILSGAPSAIRTAIRLGKRAEGVLLCSGRPPRSPQRTSWIGDQFRTQLSANPWVADSLYAIFQKRLTPAFVGRLFASSAADAPGDVAYMTANPWVTTFMAAYVAESVAVSRRGAVDEIRAFSRSGNLTAEGLTCPVEVWHGQNDRFAPLSDLLDFLGDRATRVHVSPDMGHLLPLRRWDDILRHAAGLPV